ncbi:hypothetical protein CO172_03180 [Candidatus Uhrbacteria bacterium CG_4_9_14_3_um_filter_36_7]|uniref:PPM-type phosphatase domain-containing protein n=1 Tax=Candidatus Uhrbacteria bacterium CG_4_9_14_3_um_filter_36_7 TaxID=1975033 RepID=A0A2M7XGQ2_9BACT|nr:MAG: hypothetical protein CO172_03180 [Candidatus Uhrbacteria bacterium CG_4_9_14_3_um_filter_36_7]
MDISPFSLKAAKIAQSGKKDPYGLQLILQPFEQSDGFLFACFVCNKYLKKPNPLFLLLMEELERLANSVGEKGSVQYHFEQLVKSLNEKIAIVAEEEEWKFTAQDIEIGLGMVSQEQLFLTGRGDLTALFLSKTEKKRYQVYNLFHSIQNEPPGQTWGKLFGVILDGDLHPGDTFCISNQPLQQSLPNEELNLILTTLPPSGSVEKIRQYFSFDTCVGICVIKAETQEKIVTALKATNTTAYAHQTEEETEFFLGDQQPRFIKFRQKIKSFFPLIKNWYKHGSFFISRRILFFFQSMIQFIKKQKIPSKSRKFFSSERLSKKSRYLLLGSFLTLVFLFVSIWMIYQAREKQTYEKTFREQIQSIESLQDQSEQAFIYKDENQARYFLDKSLEILQNTSENTPEQQEEKQHLIKRAQNIQNKLQHRISSSVNIVTQIPQTPETLTGSTLISLEESTYFFAQNTSGIQKIFEIKPNGVSQIISLHNQENLNKIIKTSSAEEANLFIMHEDAISMIDIASTSWKTLSLSPSSSKEQWRDLVIYGSRLYLLSNNGTETQILRFQGQGVNFINPRHWISKQTTDLMDANHIAIDGTIFISKSNGNILRFISGDESTWKIDVVDPALEQITDLWTNADSQFLYVLDSKQERIVVFEKETGKFLVQYQNELLKEAKSFIINEEDSHIWFLTESSIYNITISHLP